MRNTHDTGGWICIHRSLLDWEWFGDPHTLQLWIVCLLKANHASNKWQGVTIDRGSFITSVDSLCTLTGQTTKQIRTRIDRLEKCGAITRTATKRYQIITICNYSDYQDRNIQDNTIDMQYDMQSREDDEVTLEETPKNGDLNGNLKPIVNASISESNNTCYNFNGDLNGDQRAIKGQTKGEQRATNNNNNNENNNNNISLCNAQDRVTDTETIFEIFFFRNFINPENEVLRFIANYEASGWVRGNGQPVKNKAALARGWKQENKDAAPRFDSIFLHHWQNVHTIVKDKAPEVASTLIHDLHRVEITNERILIHCTRRLMEIIEGKIAFFKAKFFDKVAQGKSIHYRVAKI